jgi:hypothetical protein
LRRTPSLAGSLVSPIGRTPLPRLNRLAPAHRGVEVHAEAELRTLGGSVKDRAMARILAEAAAGGGLRPGVTIPDATGRSSGIASGMIAASRGCLLTPCVPENRSLGSSAVGRSPHRPGVGASVWRRRLAAERRALCSSFLHLPSAGRSAAPELEPVSRGSAHAPEPERKYGCILRSPPSRLLPPV